MKAAFLGTNGWYDTKTANTVSILIETANDYIILDAGFGFYKIGRFVTSAKPIKLFLSHLHLDHIAGLHTLNLFNFKQGIDIYAPEGMRRFLEMFVAKPYTKPISELPTKIRLHEITSGTTFDFGFEFRKLRHPVLCYGYRFDLDGKTVSYCTDTGVSKAVYKLAKDADLLIAECAFKSGNIIKDAIHLNPKAAARIAKSAGVKRLVLIHFDASLYLSLNDRKEAEKTAKTIFKDTTAAEDDEEIVIASSL